MEKVCYDFDTTSGDLFEDLKGTPITPRDLPTLVNTYIGDYWVEKDFNGTPVLCGYGTFGGNNYIQCTDSGGQNPYVLTAVEFVGGRPPVIRK